MILHLGKDTIAAVCFSADGAMVAIGDMSGIIKVYYVYSKKEIWNFETDDLNVSGSDYVMIVQGCAKVHFLSSQTSEP